ncbi:murein hydrolase activator EnvC family protein [Euzebya tangerina]|uniref:murein hydrolase activator EnvC family protein n=1 Tax=Euzebya tangerina TaxID=591198 RepID=UPI0013C30FEB|nr:M23 family metallopeptidase [Euzebya tangerina]
MSELATRWQRGASAAVLVLTLLLAGGPAGAVHAAEAGGVQRPVPGAVTRPFDPPPHPYGPGHRGVDLHAVGGERVTAPLDGTVRFAGQVAGVGWVSLEHGPALRTTYGPVTALVRRDQVIRAGQVIGVLEPDATHLDWGVLRDGEYIDPLLLLMRWRLHLIAPRR